MPGAEPPRDPSAALIARRAALSSTLTLALAILAPAVLIGWFREAWFYLVAGAIAWALAVALKQSFAKLTGRISAGTLPPILRAAGSGAWSALTELGLTGILFWLLSSPLPAAAVLAVGLGAASAEVLYLVVYGAIRHRATPAPPPAWLEGAKTSYVVQHIFLVERILAGAGHIASRALIYLSLSRHSPWPALLAFVVFAAIDGAAYYGEVKRWDWFCPATSSRYYGALAAAVVAEAAVLVVLARTA
jgi:hypothetical protein